MLRLRLLGRMRIELDGRAIEPPTSRRAQLLLAYLALHPGPHRRGELAAIFWPDVLDASARQSLRSAVWALRRALGPAGAGLVGTREEISFDEARAPWVDVREVERLLAEGLLERAVALGDGDLLAGFEDEWAYQARVAHRERIAQALETLAASAERDGDRETSIRLSRRRVALDPLDEAAQRRLMARLAAAGDRSAALATYELFRGRLRHELGVAPAAASRALADELRHPPRDAPPRAAVTPAARQLALVGRARELAELTRVWSLARAGAGGVVVLTGEAGIGKTRLAVELLADVAAAGAPTASCAALDLAGAAPLGLWAELIRDVADQVEPPPVDAAWPSDLALLTPDLERRFGREPGPRPALAPALERARLYQAVVDLLMWASRQRPLALLIEDVHIADAASLELAAFVGRRAAALPLLMILTRRPLPRSGPADALEQALRGRSALLAELELGPLADAALAQLVRAVAPLRDADVVALVAAAEGNALLAVERTRALARGDPEPPASLRMAVRSALAPLPPEPRLLAEFLAVAGRDLSHEEREWLPVASPVDAASAALETGLLVAGATRIGYRHALLREAVYADLPEPRRVWLHDRLAAVLTRRDEAPGRAAEVARHLRLAGRDKLAVTRLVAAAAQARAVAALREAAGFLEEAIELAPHDGQLLLELAEIEAWRGRVDSCEAAFARAAGLLEPDVEALAEAWQRRSEWWRGALCAPRRVLAASRRALELLDRGGLAAAHVRRRALAACAWAEAVAGDPAAGEALLSRAARLVGPEETDDLLTHLVENARALALIRRGRFADSYEPSLASGLAAIRAGRPDLSYGAFVNGSCAATCAGDFDRALAFLDRGLEGVRGTGLTALELQYHAARAYVLTRLGRLREARAASDTEVELAERLDVADLCATAAHDAGMIALAAGDHGRAAELLASALMSGAQVSRPLARLARAEALVRLGRCEEAEEELRATALEPVAPSDLPDTLVPRLARVQGLIAAARGDHAVAARRLREAAGGWRRHLGRSADGDRYAATLADLGRPPVAGLVEPERELGRVLAELGALAKATA